MSLPEPIRPPSPRGLGVRWAFLDRDGTLNVKPADGEYVEHPGSLELLPGAAEAVRTLNRAGIWTGIVTNQRGVSLGRMSIENLEAVHQRLTYLLGQHGACLDAIYTCPHGVDECDCRKPRPGMLLQAQSDFPALDFAQAAIVGDSPSDIQAGRALGLKTILLSSVGTGAESASSDADFVVADLGEAASLLTQNPPAFV